MWTIQPPPECYYKCPGEFKVVVNPGDISKSSVKMAYICLLVGPILKSFMNLHLHGVGWGGTAKKD